MGIQSQDGGGNGSPSRLLLIELSEIEQGPAGPECSLKDESLLLQAATVFNDRHVFAQLGPGLSKDASLGKLMDDLTPDDKGVFRLEIAAILPIWFPDLNARPCFALDVPLAAGESVRLAFSNRMFKIRFRRDDQPFHALVPCVHLKKFVEDAHLPEGYHIEPCKTVAATRFDARGSDAEDALERHIDDGCDRFVRGLNRVLEAHLELAIDEVPILAARLDLSNFETFYITMQGGDRKKGRAARYAQRMWFAVRNPGREYTLADTERFSALISGEEIIADARRLLNAGKSLIESASLDFGFLQIMMAAEIATKRVVDRLLRRRGVSKRTLKSYDRGLNFAQCLNVHLVSLCPPNRRPDRALIQRIDSGRKLRNELMHKADFKATRQELRELHYATARFLDFLAEVE